MSAWNVAGALVKPKGITLESKFPSTCSVVVQLFDDRRYVVLDGVTLKEV
jgi:hypothetical protein